MSWDLLIDEDALALLLPDAYAHFARPVKESLVVFLSGLPEAWQEEILAQQAALPASATVAERLGSMARSCPVLHKLGQALARDQRLAAELRYQLRQLESLPPTVPLETIEEVLSRELGQLESRAVVLQPPAIAEASVAVVIPFRESRDREARQGVFKVLKPGIEVRMEIELDLLGRVGSHLDERCHELEIPPLDYRDTFEQVRHKLASEVRLDEEQRHLAEARTCYTDDPDVLIPQLLDLCTPRITAMQRVVGVKVTDHNLDSLEEKRRLARLIMRSLITWPVFSRADRALFHSDPHAGNLLITDDQRLAILDWSLVGHLGERERIAMGQIMLGALTLNADRIVDVLEELGERSLVDRTALNEVVRDALRWIRRGQFPGLTWLVGLIDEAAHKARLRVGADLTLFRKSLLTLEGVIAELGADGFSIDEAAMSKFLGHIGNELVHRWYTHPASREFATRFSNIDLAATLISSPLAIPRFWLAEATDILEKRWCRLNMTQ